MKAFLFILLTAVLLLACGAKSPDNTALDDNRSSELHKLSTMLTQFLNTADETSALQLMDTNMQDAMRGKLASTWESLTKSAGAFVKTDNFTGFSTKGYDILELTLVFEKTTLVQRTVFNDDNLISGLFFSPGKVENTIKTIPAGITDEKITVDSGQGFPLDGLLTLPQKTTDTVIVLLHGSGASDKDESIGANKPFADLAYGLAQKGIAVLRYDKRTFAHGAKLAENPETLAKLTIYDETINDAVTAVKLMKTRFEKVFLLGHSMSGGLLAEVNIKGGNCDGYIVLAGTPRRLYELSAEQNLLVAQELSAKGDKTNAEQISAFVKSELAKATNLSRLSDEEALKPVNTIFTMSAWYLRSFEEIDTINQHLADGKPILVIHGGRDRQVTQKDFDLWQAGLQAHPDASFNLYPTLNHLMGEYKGEEVPFSEMMIREYTQSTPVSAEVVDDIASWILWEE